MLRRSTCPRTCCPQLFSGLSEAVFKELMQLRMPIRYLRGELIFQQGEFASGIYIICRGMVRVGKYYRGKRLTLELLQAGDLLGIEALAGTAPATRCSYAQALENTQLAFLEKGAFLDFCRAHPAITAGLYRQALSKIIILKQKLVRSALASADERVAGILLELGQSCGTATRAGLSLRLRLGRAELAELAGVSLETLIRSLSRLERQGLIALHDHKKITLLAPDSLGEMVLAQPTLN